MRWYRRIWLLCLVGLAGCQSVFNPIRPDASKEVNAFEDAHGSALSTPRTFAPPPNSP
jgi:hypothetical protein